MASRYSYADFQKALADSGYSFSDTDLRLAQSNPDAGMSLLNYKRDYANAETDEARMLANQGAESIRSSYGGYTGGADGSGYYLDPVSPSSFQAAAPPAFSSAYTQDLAELWERLKNYGDFEYSNQNQYQQMLDKVANRDPFSYDASTDPLYSQYRKEYIREGRRAAEDTLGAAAAMSGGRASSWANTAAAQAGNYYAAQLTDKIPELYQLAFQKYLSEFQMDQSGLAAMQADRSAEQSEWRGNYDVLAGKTGMAQSLENTDYSRYLDALAQYNTDRNFNYGQLLDEIANQQGLDQQRYERARTAELDALDRAGFAAGYGDYSGLEAQGITPDMENVLAMAMASGGRTTPVGAGGYGGGYTGSIDAGTGDDVQAIIDRAKANGKVVASREDWEILAQAKGGEDALRAAGYTLQGEGAAGGARLARDTLFSFSFMDIPDSAVAALVKAGVSLSQLDEAATEAYYEGRLTLQQIHALKEKALAAGMKK